MHPTSGPTGFPFLSLATLRSSSAPGTHLPPISIEGRWAIATRPQSSWTSPTYGDRLRSLGRRRSVARTSSVSADRSRRRGRELVVPARAAADAERLSAPSTDAEVLLFVFFERWLAGGTIRRRLMGGMTTTHVSESLLRHKVVMLGSQRSGFRIGPNRLEEVCTLGVLGFGDSATFDRQPRSDPVSTRHSTHSTTAPHRAHHHTSPR